MCDAVCGAVRVMPREWCRACDATCIMQEAATAGIQVEFIAVPRPRPLRTLGRVQGPTRPADAAGLEGPHTEPHREGGGQQAAEGSTAGSSALRVPGEGGVTVGPDTEGLREAGEREAEAEEARESLQVAFAAEVCYHENGSFRVCQAGGEGGGGRRRQQRGQGRGGQAP